MITAKGPYMKTTEEHIHELEKTIQNFESYIQDAKVTKTNLDKAQAYLDDWEQRFPPSSDSTNPVLLARMYEFQALIDFAKGNLKRVKAFIVEAHKAYPGIQFASESIQDLAHMSGQDHQVGGMPFFVVSGWRFVLMTIFTLGLYERYWFYKNWKVIQETTGRRQYPILSAIFASLVSYNLFLDIKKSAEARGYTGSFSPGWRAVAYFFFGTFALININTPMVAAGGVRHRDWNTGEIIFLVLGGLYWLINTLSWATATTTYDYDYYDSGGYYQEL